MTHIEWSKKYFRKNLFVQILSIKFRIASSIGDVLQFFLNFLTYTQKKMYLTQSLGTETILNKYVSFLSKKLY